MTATRIYVVRDGKNTPRLVRATHPATALRHVAEGTFEVAVATHDDLELLLGGGTKVETITHEQEKLDV